MRLYRVCRGLAVCICTVCTMGWLYKAASFSWLCAAVCVYRGSAVYGCVTVSCGRALQLCAGRPDAADKHGPEAQVDVGRRMAS